jgi:hypothetical protein
MWEEIRDHGEHDDRKALIPFSYIYIYIHKCLPSFLPSLPSEVGAMQNYDQHLLFLIFGKLFNGRR